MRRFISPRTSSMRWLTLAFCWITKPANGAARWRSRRRSQRRFRRTHFVSASGRSVRAGSGVLSLAIPGSVAPIGGNGRILGGLASVPATAQGHPRTMTAADAQSPSRRESAETVVRRRRRRCRRFGRPRRSVAQSGVVNRCGVAGQCSQCHDLSPRHRMPARCRDCRHPSQTEADAKPQLTGRPDRHLRRRGLRRHLRGPASRRRTTRPTPSGARWSRTAGRSGRAGRPMRTAPAASPSSTARCEPRRG